MSKEEEWSEEARDENDRRFSLWCYGLYLLIMAGLIGAILSFLL